MTVEQWSLLSGHTVGDNRTGEMIFSSERKAVYRAANEAEGGSGCVWLFEAPDETVADERRNRFYEAMFLKHENILLITGAGTAQIEQQWFTFAVTEDVERPLSKEDSNVLAPVAAGIVAGLAELHSQGLVYCALSLQSVWQAKCIWKLADFSELRVEGTYDSQETKRLMTRSDLNVPPEAWDGVVSAKWDAWSLGTLVQRLGGTQLTAELTEPDPAMRLSASEFRVPGPQPPVVSAVSEPQPTLSKPAPELPAYVAPPFPPPSLSAHSERVHRNAYRLMRRPKRAILWSWVACGAALLLLVAMTMWGRHAAEPVHHEAARTRGSSDTPTAPVQAAPVQADDNSPESVIARWVESTRMRNLDEQMRCYAPVVQQYFGRRNMRVTELRSAKAKAFQTIGPVRTFEVDHPVYRRAGDDAVVVSFQKIWDFPQRHFSGSERDRMELRRVGGEWKIVSEGELGRRAPESGF